MLVWVDVVQRYVKDGKNKYFNWKIVDKKFKVFYMSYSKNNFNFILLFRISFVFKFC